jgi:Predicted carbamoyl transferase, NodU family
MTNDKFNSLFGQKPRDASKEKLNQFHMDIASSIQEVTENILLKLTKSLRQEYDIPNLCLAGGVALNCVANGKINKDKIFENIWIQPAAGDAGGSLGAALSFWHMHLNKNVNVKKNDQMNGSYLGPEFSQDQIKMELDSIGAKYEVLSEDEIFDKTTDSIINEEAVGWFQGRMEFGPRALGSRSILADPRSNTMQKNLNLKVKYRESFRPFAPSILKEDVQDWFDLQNESPYMLLVANVNNNKSIEMTMDQKKLFGIEKLNMIRSKIPAVTHVDYSARIQTVDKDTNPKYYKLISKFKDKTGCPI